MPSEVIARGRRQFHHRRDIGASRWPCSLPRIGRWLAASFSPALRRSAPWRRRQAAHRETGAVAVDMESCRRRASGRRLTACRSSPCASSSIPRGDTVPAAVVAASAAGQVRIGRLICGLLLSPADIAPLLRLARRYRIATRSLDDRRRLGRCCPQAAAPASHEGAGHGRHRIRRRRRRAGAAARGLAGAGAGARRLGSHATCKALPVEIAVGDLTDPRIARARARRLRGAVPRRRRLPAGRAATRSSCTAPTSRAPATSCTAARRAGVDAHRLHQQRRDHRHTERRHAGR